jgi:hypothetical protein
MSGGKQLLDCIEIDLINNNSDQVHKVYIDIIDNSLTRKWLPALNTLLKGDYHLEKNYCFFGFSQSDRNSDYLISEINKTFTTINKSSLDYHIDDVFTRDNVIQPGVPAVDNTAGEIFAEKTNMLHRYFEELQGTAGTGGHMSNYYNHATPEIKWNIRQLNLLCHELETCVISERKANYLPEWQRPCQLMCWLNAPRFELTEEDYEYFGVETLNRDLGDVYIGVNKAVGKAHWEVFNDEGDRDIDELTTLVMRSQSQAAGDFDIEWANSPGKYKWHLENLENFKQWLVKNGFDPSDKSLTIGHPKCGQVDLQRSFGTDDYNVIWDVVGSHLNVHSIKTSDAHKVFPYNWNDSNYQEQQMEYIT